MYSEFLPNTIEFYFFIVVFNLTKNYYQAHYSYLIAVIQRKVSFQMIIVCILILCSYLRYYRFLSIL